MLSSMHQLRSRIHSLETECSEISSSRIRISLSTARNTRLTSLQEPASSLSSRRPMSLFTGQGESPQSYATHWDVYVFLLENNQRGSAPAYRQLFERNVVSTRSPIDMSICNNHTQAAHGGLVAADHGDRMQATYLFCDGNEDPWFPSESIPAAEPGSFVLNAQADSINTRWL